MIAVGIALFLFITGLSTLIATAQIGHYQKEKEKNNQIY